MPINLQDMQTLHFCCKRLSQNSPLEGGLGGCFSCSPNLDTLQAPLKGGVEAGSAPRQRNFQTVSKTLPGCNALAVSNLQHRHEGNGMEDQTSKIKMDRGGKYLTFTLADEDYGIEILKVKEIIGMMPITTVPQTPDFVKGVVNLRGKVIPVVDLRLKFGMASQEYTERTCIIVVEIFSNSGSTMMGIVVDSVSEVVQIRNDDIEETPQFGTKLDTDYILGMAKTDGRVKILLAIDKILTAQELCLALNAA
jgi:purine-binding chemotaxis protein CheW